MKKENGRLKLYTPKEVKALLETLRLDISTAVRLEKYNFFDEMLALLDAANKAGTHISNPFDLINKIYKRGYESYDKSAAIVIDHVNRTITTLSEE